MKIIYDKCNGCSACSLTCPANAITLSLNEYGFYQAFIIEDKCIKCGKCDLTCQNCKKALFEIPDADHYVSVAKDRTILKRSSSGGLAYLLAKKIIEAEKGTVYSVGYNSDTLNAQHIRIDSIDELQNVQGSKYLQSYNIDAFQKAIKESGKVIVFGTPCQIAGFREAIKKNPNKERFVLIDIFCHGVPSTKLWHNHIYSKGILNSHDGIDSPIFRENKKYFLHYKKYRKWYNQDGFLMLFLMTKYLNRACYSCPFRRMSSADIRLGDLMSSKYDCLWYSPSCVCVNTDVGRTMLDSIRDELDIYPVSYKEIDDIQQKDSNYDPLVDTAYNQLTEDDITPQKLLGKRYYYNYIKSFIKIPLILIRARRYTDDLGAVIKRGDK